VAILCWLLTFAAKLHREKNMKMHLVSTLVCASALVCLSTSARVVINEISYHPPNDSEALEYVEVHNA
jgi:fucose permease